MGGLGQPPASVVPKINILTGLISSPAGVNLNLLPGTGGITKVGSGTPGNLGTPTNNDAYITGRLEVDGNIYADAGVYSGSTNIQPGSAYINGFCGTNNGYTIGAASQYGALVRSVVAPGNYATFLGLTSTANYSLIVADYALISKNFDHTAQIDPTIIGHSATDPDSDNTQYWSDCHNKTHALRRTGTGGQIFAPFSGVVYFTTAAKQATNFGIHAFHATVTLATDSDTTDVGLTVTGLVVGAAIRVSTQIDGLDSADHHVKLGVAGTTDRYCDASEGASQTYIEANKKAKYNGAQAETAALILTIDGGSDNIPSAGAVEVEVHYLAQADIPSV